MKWWEDVKDRVLGKRHVAGWPRGVRPMAPDLRSLNHMVAERYPELWEEVRHRPAFEALTTLKARGVYQEWQGMQ